MLKILKGDLEAKERSISVGSTYSETSPNRYPSSALYSGFKSFSKKFVFCDENHYPNRWVKITDPHAWKRFLTSNGHCFICFEKSHVASSCNKIINLTNVIDVTTFQFVPFLNQRIAHRLRKMDSLKILKVLPRLMIKILLQTTFQLIEIIFWCKQRRLRFQIWKRILFLQTEKLFLTADHRELTWMKPFAKD